jgi:5-methyltetrahydrofolate--homocysteine methyltransferase
MYEAFAEQAVALKEGGVDFFLVETFYDLQEAREAVRACRREADLPVVASITYDPQPDGGFRTAMGTTPAEAHAALLAEGAAAAGTNCSNSIDVMIGIARAYRAAGVSLPLFVMPNAGVPEVVGKKTIYRETPEKMASRVAALVAAGANVVGGCCGTTPEHIRLFRQVLDRRTS